MARRTWIVVVGERTALDWVLRTQQVAFRSRSASLALGRLRQGDQIAVYATRGVFHNPTRDQSEFLATAVATSDAKHLNRPRVVAGREFTVQATIRFDAILRPRSGVAAGDVAPNLSFVRKKPQWGQYFRHGLIDVPPKDFAVIRSAIRSSGTRVEPDVAADAIPVGRQKPSRRSNRLASG